MILQVSDLSKSYGAQPILANITFQILPRERVGLVGVNGAGKSTLLKMITGDITPDSGTIYKAKETSIGYLAQTSGLQTSTKTIDEEMRSVFTHLTAMEQQLRQLENDIANPALHDDEASYQLILERYATVSERFRELGGFEMEARMRSILHGMGFAQFAPDTAVSTLSGGQKTRLSLARILLEQPNLLLLDEPTNYLDITTLTWLENYLRSYDGAVLVVSHDRYFLDRVVETIVEIERHAAKRYTGNYSRYMEIKADEYEIQLKHYSKQQHEIAKMEQFIQKNIVRASTTKRAQSRRKALASLDRLDKPLGELKKAHFSFEIDRPTGVEVLQVNQLAVQFEQAKTPLFSDISFRIERGQRVALIGRNGIGKSTLLKALVHQQPLQTGSIRWGSNVKIGYFDQEHVSLQPQNTILEEVWGNYPHVEEARVRTVLGNFLFSGDDVLKKVSSLSGGEKARVSLAKLMLERANVLILDEPTNHLDLFSKEVLENALLDYDGTLLFISHDRYFLNTLADHMFELTESSMKQYLGNYDDMLEKQQIEAEWKAEEQLLNPQVVQTKATAPVATSASSYEADKQAKREERAKQRKIEALELAIAELEEKISQAEMELAEPSVFSDYVRFQQIERLLDEYRSQLAEMYEQWDDLLA